MQYLYRRNLHFYQTREIDTTIAHQKETLPHLKECSFRYIQLVWHKYFTILILEKQVFLGKRAFFPALTKNMYGFADFCNFFVITFSTKTNKIPSAYAAFLA